MPPLPVHWYSFRRPRKDARLIPAHGVNSAETEFELRILGSQATTLTGKPIPGSNSMNSLAKQSHEMEASRTTYAHVRGKDSAPESRECGLPIVSPHEKLQKGPPTVETVLSVPWTLCPLSLSLYLSLYPECSLLGCLLPAPWTLPLTPLTGSLFDNTSIMLLYLFRCVFFLSVVHCGAR